MLGSESILRYTPQLRIFLCEIPKVRRYVLLKRTPFLNFRVLESSHHALLLMLRRLAPLSKKKKPFCLLQAKTRHMAEDREGLDHRLRAFSPAPRCKNVVVEGRAFAPISPPSLGDWFGECPSHRGARWEWEIKPRHGR